MEVSILLMQQIAQLFIVLLMGYVVVKAGLLKASDSKVLSVVFVYLVMPCVVLNAFQIDDTPQIRTGLLYSMGIAVGMHIVFLVLNAIVSEANQPHISFKIKSFNLINNKHFLELLHHLLTTKIFFYFPRPIPTLRRYPL